MNKRPPLPDEAPLERLAKPFQEFADLVFGNAGKLETAKVRILAASVAAGITGMLILVKKSAGKDTSR